MLAHIEKECPDVCERIAGGVLSPEDRETVLEKAKAQGISATALGSLYMIGDIKSYIKSKLRH